MLTLCVGQTPTTPSTIGKRVASAAASRGGNSNLIRGLIEYQESLEWTTAF